MRTIGRLTGLVLALALLGFASVSFQKAPLAQAESLEELRAELKSKQGALKSAEEKIKKFSEEVQLRRREARTLSEQIDIIGDNIVQIQLNIAQTTAEIDTTELQIKTVEREIEEREKEIVRQKQVLAEFLRTLYEFNQQSNVALILKYATFSEAVTEASTLQELQERSHEALLTIKKLKEELEKQQNDLKEVKEKLETLKKRQQNQQSTLETNREAKEEVLVVTKQKEQEFSSLLKSSQQAHKAAEAEIKRLDAAIRAELERQGSDELPSVGTMSWPVERIFGISCGFHCAGYPYAYLIGPHSGIDIPTYVGTPIAAPADGYVGRVRDAGGPGYSYLLLLHGDNVSTVFGHISKFAVQEGKRVKRGDVIGFTGGAPGSRGAGLSSGPHLHFEVRKNNRAVNPMNYL